MSTAAARLYETDFYGWIQNQAAALRTRSLANLDFDNLVEEIESVGKSEKRELESRLESLLMHLLKWQYQPNFRSASWQITIKDQRRRIADHLEENPSLKNFVPKSHEKIYSYAVTEAAKETGMSDSTFPSECPWTFEQAMAPDFWPEQECAP